MQAPDPCMLCNSSRFQTIYRKNGWQYLRCLGCGLVSIHPKPSPDSLSKIYQEYLPSDPKEIQRWQKMTMPVIRKSADLLESRLHSQNLHLLDIGSGYGFFLQEMKSRGWDVEGVELSEAGRQYAWERWGIHVHHGPIESLDIPGGSLNAVTLFYVIEHLLDPKRLLKEIKRILVPGGIVLIRWPHSTPVVRILGPISQYLDLYHTPYHIHDFSPLTMRKLLRSAGFSRIETVIGGHTKLPGVLNRAGSVISGHVAQALFCLSGGRVLMPGVSKTSFATKDYENP